MSTKNKMIVEKIKQCGTINLERTLRETETNIPKERKCFSMKKIAPILLAMVLALTLCLVGFADAESYDDDPLEETAASTSEEALEEAEPVPARSSECDACGKMSSVTQNASIIPTGRTKSIISILRITRSAVPADTSPAHGLWTRESRSGTATGGRRQSTEFRGERFLYG